ncbi:MAG: 60S ribosomal export protein NMD3 [Thermoplasmatales archaeon]|nr:MAG: 60S ribosomal export protein NMD3 [Thermoplasmatales archaeon]
MFCVECGREDKIFRDGTCLNCYLKSHTFTKGPKIIELSNCPHCDSFKFKNTWISEHFGDILKKAIKINFQISKELDKVDINSECTEKKEGMICKVYISGFIENEEIIEEHEILVRFDRTVCDVCSKRFGGYHEAIVQIRADNRKLKNKELIDIRATAESLIEDLQAEGNRALFITDIAEEHGGLDFYISEKAAGLAIAKKIQEKYGGEIKQSSKNIGMKDSKQMYRMTYLIRIPSYEKGFFLKIDNSFFQIISFHGNKVKLIDLSKWNETTFDVKSIQKSSILGGEELIKEMILISQTNDEVQVMDQKNYKINIVKKPKQVSFDSKTVKTVKLNDRLFLIPVV